MALWMILVGLSCVSAALYHGYLGETKLIAPATFTSRQAKLLVSAIWQFSTASWVVCGVLLAASPWMFSHEQRLAAVGLICTPIAFGVVINCVITKGRHFGWMVFASIIAAAIGGVLVSQA